MDRVADIATREFGAFDTWVNNAGISIYGKLTDVPMDDKRRLFETNFWGVVNGCRTAVHHFSRSRRHHHQHRQRRVGPRRPAAGHVLGLEARRAGYTDALRMELEHDRLPIQVTLVKPARSTRRSSSMRATTCRTAPTFPPPVYAPEVVAHAILRCAERRVREVTVGGGGRMMTILGAIAPRMTNKCMESAMFAQQKDRRGATTMDSLYQPEA